MEDYESLSHAQKQRLNQKGYYFNGSTHNLNDIDNIKHFITEFPFYSYIIHSPDVDSDSIHIHFLLNVRGTRKIKDVAEILHCSYGDVQKCRSQNNYARYMLHLDRDDKKDHYSVSDVITNDIDRFESFLSSIRPSVNNLYSDFCSLRSGKISRQDFVDKYKGDISSLNFYQKVRVFKDIDSVAKF